MLKKRDKFFTKIVKKNYNDELEKVLESKAFEEEVKSVLLSILYKLEISYKDYQKVKQNVETKEELIRRIIEQINLNCDEIKLIKPNLDEINIIGDRTFLVEKSKKRIICYNMERKILYSISKISKNNKIIKDRYFLVDETLSNLINVGNNINTVEPIRDFNGYSWTTITREIESIEHNLIYQNLIGLVGNEFLNKWIYDKECNIDYLELFANILEKKYGEENSNIIIDILKNISILIAIKFDNEKEIFKIKNEIESKIEKIKDNQKFIEYITKQKRKLAKEIKLIDEIINNKELLKEEYEKRNKDLPIEKKIFSMKVLAKIMADERNAKIGKIDKYNQLLKPKNFIKYKEELEQKEKQLKILEYKDLQLTIDEYKLTLQKVFFKCFEKNVELVETKQEILKKIYEFRYYNLLPYNKEKAINEVEELKEIIEQIGKKILQKAHKLKVVQRFSKYDEIDYQLLKVIFEIRNINLENLYLKMTKEKNEFFMQIFDENAFEEKNSLSYIENLNKKNVEIMLNKKVKIFY